MAKNGEKETKRRKSVKSRSAASKERAQTGSQSTVFTPNQKKLIKEMIIQAQLQMPSSRRPTELRIKK